MNASHDFQDFQRCQLCGVQCVQVTHDANAALDLCPGCSKWMVWQMSLARVSDIRPVLADFWQQLEALHGPDHLATLTKIVTSGGAAAHSNVQPLGVASTGQRTQHSPECLAHNAEMKARHDAWVKQWPHYCRACNGTGVGASTPATRWDPGDSEECQECLGQDCYLRDDAGALVYAEVSPGVTEGPYKPQLVIMPDPRCPRCFGPITPRDDQGPCASCGWDHDDCLPLADNECMGECMAQPDAADGYPF